MTPPPGGPPGLTRPDSDPLAAPITLPSGAGQVRRAVPYSAPPGYRPIELDLYTPAGPPAPVVLFVHGGGWRLGTRAVFCPTWSDWSPDPFERIVAAGFAVASLDYRLSGEATFPAQLDDLQAGLRWLGLRGAELGIDAERVVVWGESAGGHLAALLGLTADTLQTPGARVVGVVDWYGASDLSTLAEQSRPDAIAAADAPDSREALLLGTSIAAAGELARAASPVSHVRSDSPAFHLAHGDRDRFVPVGQSRQFAETLRAAGVPVEYLEVADSDHLWMGAADPASILQAALDFATRVTTGGE